MKGIGIYQMWKGFIPLLMEEHQDLYYDTIETTDTGVKWCKIFIKIMMEGTKVLGKYRCHILHPKSLQGLHEVENQALRKEVDRSYSEGKANIL